MGSLLLAACTTAPTLEQGDGRGKTVCDSYIVLEMCVHDLVGDGVVDMVYFTDTLEIFMYREGMKEAVAQLMPFHQCAVPLSAQMQEITDRALNRKSLSFAEEIGVMKDMLAAYLAAKPEIDACNERFAKEGAGREKPLDEFYIDESDWDD